VRAPRLGCLHRLGLVGAPLLMRQTLFWLVPPLNAAGLLGHAMKRDAELIAMEREAASSGFIKRTWLTHFARAMRAPREIQHATSAAIPKTMFVLVPLFALLVGSGWLVFGTRLPPSARFIFVLGGLLVVAIIVGLAAMRFLRMRSGSTASIADACICVWEESMRLNNCYRRLNRVFMIDEVFIECLPEEHWMRSNNSGSG